MLFCCYLFVWTSRGFWGIALTEFAIEFFWDVVADMFAIVFASSTFLGGSKFTHLKQNKHGAWLLTCCFSCIVRCLEVCIYCALCTLDVLQFSRGCPIRMGLPPKLLLTIPSLILQDLLIDFQYLIYLLPIQNLVLPRLNL